MVVNKVELCGVNTSKLPLLRENEITARITLRGMANAYVSDWQSEPLSRVAWLELACYAVCGVGCLWLRKLLGAKRNLPAVR